MAATSDGDWYVATWGEAVEQSGELVLVEKDVVEMRRRNRVETGGAV